MEDRLQKYELVNSCKTIKALKDVIISFGDEEGLIQGRTRKFDAKLMARGLDYYFDGMQLPNVLTREFGIRQQSMYLKYYLEPTTIDQSDQYLKPNASYYRLVKEYQTHGSLVIGVDFDGTIHDFHKTGAQHEQVKQLIRDLKSINCKIIIWTAYEDHNYVKQFCIDNNIPIDGINTDGIPLDYETRKPFFSCLIDDRAGLIQVYDELTSLVDFVKYLDSQK